MLNLHHLFDGFHEKINLTKGKRENLMKGREALRNKIREYFKEKEGVKTPRFCGQGSYMMGTIINPLPEEEYDLDDGVYLLDYNNKPRSDWPTPQTVHRWIHSAVEDHTDTPPEDKNTCVRVIYAGQYHIDLPCYIIENEEICNLAHKKHGWTQSDPKAFTEWFHSQLNDKGEQLRRCVKYLKAWKDKCNLELPGIVVTILAARNFYSSDNRDDKSMLGTVTRILNKLETNYSCYKPVIPKDENLLEDHSETTKETTLRRLYMLKERLEESFKVEDEYEASLILVQEFGERFPKGEKGETSNTEYLKTSSPAVLGSSGDSA